MKVGLASRGAILQPCSLEGYAHQLDPYIGCEHHCYYCYALNRAETDWMEEILMHRDFVRQLRHELSGLEPQAIYMGWNTDPYQPAERGHRQTRQALELLAHRGFSVCILTKSDLITRDIDLLATMPDPSAGVSIAFQDEDVRRLFEANAPPNKRRVAALKALKDAGIRTYTLICPVMPFLTDVEALIEMVAPFADRIWIYPLSMEAEEDRNWRYVKEILDRHLPELTERYREIAFSAAHPYWTRLRRKLEEFQGKTGLDLRIEL
jgi:DNA repair photolyase